MSLKYTSKFKAQMLSLKQSGHRERDLCKRYNLGHSTISRWEQEYAKTESEPQSVNLPLSDSQHKDKRIEDLEFEVVNLKEEIDILKAAVSLLCKKKELK
jgi:transposase